MVGQGECRRRSAHWGLSRVLREKLGGDARFSDQDMMEVTAIFSLRNRLSIRPVELHPHSGFKTDRRSVKYHRAELFFPEELRADIRIR